MRNQPGSQRATVWQRRVRRRSSSKITSNAPTVIAESARLNAGQTKCSGAQLQKIGDAAVQQPIEQIPRRAAGNQRQTRLAGRCSCAARDKQPASSDHDGDRAGDQQRAKPTRDADSENKPKAMPEFTLCTRAANFGISSRR